MNKNLLSICVALLIGANLFGQLSTNSRVIYGSGPAKTQMKKISGRSATNPKTCGVDTSYFPSYSTSMSGGAYQYRSLLVGQGHGLGQFYGAPAPVTVSGFRFYGYLIYDTLTQVKNTTVKCRLYKAGPDSLPLGNPLASTEISIDTVDGQVMLSRCQRDINFSTPVLCDFPYIITIESDSISSKPEVISNAWQYGDGEGRNLACGSVSGIWYRCLNLNIAGTTFDAHMQFYPFVQYKFGTDFTSNINCYNLIDTLRFTNSFQSNMLSSIFYNSYQYYEELGMGYQDLCHDWTIDGNFTYLETLNAKHKSSTKKNITVELRSKIVTYSNDICYDTTVKTIYFKPALPILAKPAYGCIGDSLRITVKGDVGSTFKWFNKPTDANPFFTGAAYTIAKVAKADTFYVQAVNGDCNSAYLIVQTKASNYPTKLTFKNDSICSGAVANLSGTADYGVLEWYNTKTGGTRLGTGTTFVSGKLTADTNFYLTSNNGGCFYKGARAKVSVLVGSKFAPLTPTNTNDTAICFSTSTTVKLHATPANGTTCRWFTDALQYTPVATGNTYSATVNSRGLQTYFVESWNGTCGSGKIPVVIDAAQYPSTFAKSNATICSGDSAVIYAFASWGNIEWYKTKTGSMESTDKRYVLNGLPIGVHKMYFKTVENNCVNPDFDSCVITVNTAPNVTSVTNNDQCYKGIGQITVKVPSGKVNWYTSETATNVYATGTTVSTPKMYSNVTLYYSTTEFGCDGARTPVTVKSLPRPVAGFEYNITPNLNISCTPIQTQGMTFAWNWGDGNKSTGLPAQHQYASEGNYTINLVTTSTTNVCTDTVNIPVSVKQMASTKNLSTPVVTLFPNPVKGGNALNIKGIVTNQIHWYDVSGREVAVEKVVDNTSIVPTKLSTGMYFIKGENAKQAFSASVYINN